MANISNKIKCELMNKMYKNKDISEFVTQHNISQKVVNLCKKELEGITEGLYESDNNLDLSSNELDFERKRFRKYSWEIIQKANQIIIEKLNLLSVREKEIDRLLEKVEYCLEEDMYDKTQMGKLLKLLENMKQNNISELARVIQILYDKQEDYEPNTEEDTLENLLDNISGENF